MDAGDDTVVANSPEGIKTAWRPLCIDSRQCEQLCHMQEPSHRPKCKVGRPPVICVAWIRGVVSSIQGTDDAMPLRIDAKQ